jgi:iron complex transport system substrate-binding protein
MLPLQKLLQRAILLLPLVTCVCTPENKPGIEGQDIKTQLALDYAERFEVWESEDLVEIIVSLGKDSGESFKYVLIPSGSNIPKHIAAAQIIEVPVKNMVVTSTSHLPFLDLLDASANLVGFPNTKYVSSTRIRSRIDQGLVKEVGDIDGLDFEILIELQPELVVSYISGADRNEIKQLKQAGIPTVLNLDFLENSPLGRAEWIKFMGLLLGKFEFADSVFKGIERNYLELQALVDIPMDRPKVFSGIVYGDTWFAPGGNSFVSKFIQDAGGDYSWSDYPDYGSIELSFEAILERNTHTEFWIGSGAYTSRKDLQASDHRYAYFQAFKNDRVYNYHGRIGATGGFEYLETAGARPDLVLGDIIKILHPSLLPEYQTQFFKKLD